MKAVLVLAALLAACSGRAHDGGVGSDAGVDASGSAAQLTPTTTLTIETANNTSASSSFTALSNGDAAPGNVSNVSIKKLLPSNFTGGVLAHWMPWWQCTNAATAPCNGVHSSKDGIEVHYSTQDPAQLDATIEDMMRRGYDGIMVAESNSGSDKTASTLAMATDVAKYPTFRFSVSENHLDSLSTEAEQLAKLQSDMTFASASYFDMPNYLKVGDRPVVYVFDNGSIDWSTASSQVAGNPIFVVDGPSHATATLPAFYWFGGLSANTEYSTSQIVAQEDSFLATVASHPQNQYSGSFFKGFNDTFVDTISGWGMHRIVDQSCGLTFVRSVSAIGSYLASSSAAMPFIQNATWNDYEEGTELETGIDNCGSVSADVAGTIITPQPAFTGAGSEETVDHYSVYVVTDGEQLADIDDSLAIGDIFDLATLHLPPATYTVYVKMVGKSHIQNHMSPPVTVTIQSL